MKYLLQNTRIPKVSSLNAFLSLVALSEIPKAIALLLH